MVRKLKDLAPVLPKKARSIHFHLHINAIPKSLELSKPSDKETGITIINHKLSASELIIWWIN